MSGLTYRITTLGCRVNHAEARDLESILIERGLRRVFDDQRADLEVIHTCSVTGVAAAKSRHAIRKASRRSSGPPIASIDVVQDHALSPNNHSPAIASQVIVTGCFTSTNPKEAAELTADHGRGVIPHNVGDESPMIERFALRIDDWLDEEVRPQIHIRPIKGVSSTQSPLPLRVVPPRGDAGSHIRAELQIQDGCDAHCTFCIIPSIRKTLRSKTIDDVCAEARMLVDLGHQEIVLTGIFIGAYGHETALRRNQVNRHAHPLADLIDAVAQVSGLKRLRLSSMEPGDVSEPLLDAMLANAPVVVPHLHLPLQSGSDEVLRRMNRQYRVGDYLDMIDQVNEALTTPGSISSSPTFLDSCTFSVGLPPAITTDIICGFPGETPDNHQQTLDIAQKIGFLHMHVFPYSPRSGTAAARWKDLALPASTIKSRVRQLIDLEQNPASGLSLAYRQRLLGRTLRIILEQPLKPSMGAKSAPEAAPAPDAPTSPPLMTGRCDHYALITLATDQPRGAFINATITEVTPDQTLGELAPDSIPLAILR